MKFQDDISNMNTYIHTDKPKPICPPLFQSWGHKKCFLCTVCIREQICPRVQIFTPPRKQEHKFALGCSVVHMAKNTPRVQICYRVQIVYINTALILIDPQLQPVIRLEVRIPLFFIREVLS